MKAISANKKKTLVLLLAIVLLALVLRTPNFGHFLSYDEAFNVHAAYGRGQAVPHDVWSTQLRVHPPDYMYSGVLFERVTGASRQDLAVFMEALSILAALGILVLIYFCGKDWFDEKTGLIAAFFYAVLPAARVFDTWIKQDALMMFFTLAFVFLFFKKRYIWAGLLLGLALLTKETVVFIVLAAGVFLLVSRRFREIGRLALSFAVAFLVSFWWYLFFSTSEGRFVGLFLGNTREAQLSKSPWYTYLVKAPQDFVWIVVALLLLGVVLFAFDFKKKGRPQMVTFLFCWIGVPYFILSAAPGKFAWLIHPVLPPIALLAGWSLARVYELVSDKRVAIALVGVVLIAALLLSAIVSFNGYLGSIDRNLLGWQYEKNAAEYINGRTPGTVAIGTDDANPVFLYYLNSYDPRKMEYISAGAVPASPGTKSTVFLVDSSDDLATFNQVVKRFGPKYVVLRYIPVMAAQTPESKAARDSLIEAYMKLEPKPGIFGESLVFNGYDLIHSGSSAQ